MHREHGRERGSRDQGERMSSGWGPPLELRDRDRIRDRDDGGRSRDRDSDARGVRDQDERPRGYGRDDERGGLPIEETSRLIGSNKVEGTTVYGRDGHRLGTIYNFMVDKLSGRVEYAVMKYGGMLGMGQRYYPLPWQMLTYDTREGGYRIDMTERDLQDAPSFDRDTEPHFNESYGDRVHSWYGLGRR
jgi:sporulation protein YlmC with PRC-barrel domain